MTAYTPRLTRAQEVMRAEGVAGLVLAPTPQMRYLTGWAEPGHERLIALFLPATGDPTLVVPAINADQARTNPAAVRDVRAWTDEAGWHGAAHDILREWQVGAATLAVDDELDSVHLLGLQGLAPEVRCVPAGPLMARLRQVKADDELTLLRRSAAVTDAVYEESLGALTEGMTEIDLQEAISQAYRRRGARVDFALICFGPNSALPHHHTGQARLRRGDVIILDIGCSVEGYASDITRTVAFASADTEAARVYDVVLAAHLAAVGAGRPGVPCEDVDAAARRVIADAGYGDRFIHRTGHGIGLAGHEPPYIVAGNRQLLEETMCFSVEPGVYLPDRFGVRIENIVTVTAEGLESLNAAPPSTLLVVGS